MKWYQLSGAAAAQQLKTDIKTGLSPAEAQDRLKEQGLNELPEVKRDSWALVFIRQFQSPLIYILLVAAVLIFFVGEHRIDAFIISAILLFNAVIGTIQEGRTQTILDSLKKFVKTDTVVLRNGVKEIVSDTQLVPGDIIVLQQGNKVPADARVLESQGLHVDQAALTGESVPVEKHEEALAHDSSIADQHNMLFKGTYITSGAGKAVVIATGLRTEIGKIHTTTQQTEVNIPLRKELERLSYFILLFILGVCIFLLVIGVLTGKPLQELLVTLTALFICVVPEGLPVVLTLVLVSGAYRMAQHNVLIKNLQAVDGLGRVDTIMIDKTGTVTRGEMMVTALSLAHESCSVSGRGYDPAGKVMCAGQERNDTSFETELGKMGIAAALLNSAQVTLQNQEYIIKGDPTEAALSVFAQKLGFHKETLLQEFRRIFEIPFHAQLRFHAEFFERDGTGMVFILGSPESLEKRAAPITPYLKEQLAQFLEQGFRVVMCGYKTVSLKIFDQSAGSESEKAFELLESGIEIIGIYGIQDTIRQEVAESINQARTAGIRIVMASGDHQRTTQYIAQQVGIYDPQINGAVDGSVLRTYTDHDLANKLSHITVYSRVSPEDKLRLVQALEQQGEIVAMTGDGINDAPSLVAADVGIAMGSGTDIAKEAADVVLLDDSLVNIVKGIELGRHTLYTIRRVVLYFFATNLGEILIVLFALIVGMPLPLLAAQILWLNLVTDGFLDMALSMEPYEKNLLSHDAFKKVRLVDLNLFIRMVWMAIPMAVGSLLMFAFCLPYGLTYARTATLITMAMFQWFNAWNCRSEHTPLYRLGIFTNKWLLAATSVVFLLQIALLYVPFLRTLFGTVPLELSHWFIIILVSSTIFILEEIRKIVWYIKK